MLPPTRPSAPHPVAAHRDLPPAPGVTLLPEGIDISVYAGHAEEVTLCLFDAGDTAGASERRIPLTERAHGWWFGYVPGVGVGQRYGFRVDGQWRPDEGLRHNPHQLLLDPYARAIEGEVRWGPEVFAHVVGEDLLGDSSSWSVLDSAGSVPRSVVVDDDFDWEGDEGPGHGRAESVVYEVHVKDLTARHPGVPEALRGTYAGLANPATIAHLTSLGVTAVELLPIHASVPEPALVKRGMTNHWGYNTIGLLRPARRLRRRHRPPGGRRRGQGHGQAAPPGRDRGHPRRGLQPHGEQDRTGPTLSLRGLDNRAYYRLDEHGRDIDVTGCGNTMDLRHPVVARLVLDSLRRWVNDFHVDGFRFDLAVALGRGRDDDYDPDHPFLIALRTDPVLSRVKLIAEPWDVGPHGWRTGQFPPPFSEWNDRYRDSVRTFWVQDRAAEVHGRETGMACSDLATRLAGSRDLFGSRDRGPVASVNFVTAHDGFTLADLVSYDRKHNEANERGPRRRHQLQPVLEPRHRGPDPRAQGGCRPAPHDAQPARHPAALDRVPMISGGDELGRTQGGQQQPLLPGQRDHLVRLEPRVLAA